MVAVPGIRRSSFELVVIYYGVCRVAILQCRSIDYQRLYRRTRLPVALECPVQSVARELLASSANYCNYRSGLIIDADTGALGLVDFFIGLICKGLQSVVYALLELLLDLLIQSSVDAVAAGVKLFVTCGILCIIPLLISLFLCTILEFVLELKSIDIHQCSRSTPVDERLHVIMVVLFRLADLYLFSNCILVVRICKYAVFVHI